MGISLAVLVVAFGVAFVGTWFLIPRLRAVGIVGKDVHKANQPEIPEMGGLALVAGFSSGMIFVLGLKSYLHLLPQVNTEAILASLATALLVGLIGLLDDHLGMCQWVKAILPLFAAVPLAAIRVGDTWMTIPYLRKGGLLDLLSPGARSLGGDRSGQRGEHACRVQRP